MGESKYGQYAVSIVDERLVEEYGSSMLNVGITIGLK